MKLLANENFPRVAVEALRDAGYDVLWARTDMGGAADDVILQRAQDEDRTVVTFDKDFGELAFRWGLPASCGVILFRLRTRSPEHVQQRVIKTLAEHLPWKGHFFVVEEHRIRVRPLGASTTDDDSA
jgi:predicted nuclease of predicted toxin-antitoxin system